MADVDQLTALGQMLATALVNSYGSDVPGGNLVFLPVGVAVADDIVQGGVVNATQLQQWLAINFDFPFMVSPGDAAVLTQEDAHGTASFIYSLALTQAQPLGAPTDPAWQRVAGELNSARAILGPAPAQMNLMCEPDDWASPAATSYWTTFDSKQIASTSTTSTTVVPPTIPHPPFWQIRRFEPLVDGVPPSRRLEEPFMLRPRLYAAASALPLTARASPFALDDRSIAQRSAIDVAAPAQTAQVAMARPEFDVARIMNASSTVTNVTTSTTANITLHLEHQCVQLGRYSAGAPCWNGGLLADPGWYVPGFAAGGILPAPVSAQAGAVYGLPVAMIVVSQLKVSGQWSQDALAALSAPRGSVGPLALFGAVATTESDGVTISFSHDGMQVVALLCSPLPIIPLSGAPNGTASAAPAASPSATANGSAPASSTAAPGNSAAGDAASAPSTPAGQSNAGGSASASSDAVTTPPATSSPTATATAGTP